MLILFTVDKSSFIIFMIYDWKQIAKFTYQIVISTIEYIFLNGVK